MDNYKVLHAKMLHQHTKGKSQSSWSGAYDLLIEIVKGNMDNYKVLHA